MGPLGLVVGAAIGISHAVRNGPTPAAGAGSLVLLAGAVLPGRAGRDAFTVVPGWWQLTFVPTAFVVFQFVLVPVTATVMAVDPPRSPLGAETPADYGLRYTDVAFATADGVRLSGWYMPSRNGAAVAVLHGSGSSRTDVLPQAAAVASRGYGVLLHDDRGHGLSGGTGWRSARWGDGDLGAGLSWLQDQGDVDPDHLGVVGIPMGGEQALNLAATDRRIQVVMAEGVQPRSPQMLSRRKGSMVGPSAR